MDRKISAKRKTLLFSLERPTKKEVLEYYRQYQNTEKDCLVDETISELLKKFPENTEIKDIYNKVVVINALYSAGVIDTFRMSKHIQKLNIDSKLNKGNLEVIDKIARLPKIRNFYAFATKYCSFHNPDKYPIYDSFVHKMLIAYRDKGYIDGEKFDNFNEAELRNYFRFKEILDEFIKFNNLNNLSYKQIDKFLWMKGKELFPNK